MLYVPPQDASSGAKSRLRVSSQLLWRRRYSLLALIGGVAVIAIFGVPRALGPRIEASRVIRADLIQTVVATGNVLAPYRVNIASQITGIVSDVPVAQGQTVNAGDALVILDDREARAVVVQAEGAVAQAEARLRQIRELTLPSAKEALAQAKATLLNAQQAYDRADQLAKAGYGTRATLDDATRALDVARAQVRSNEFQVFTNSPGGSDHVMAETQLNQAEANLTTAKSRLSYTVISAPRDGVLITRNVERGNVVQPSNVLMTLSPFGETQLVVQVDEKNFGLIAVGQNALGSADAFPRETFKAEVIYINPGIDLQRATVEVKLRVLTPPPYLRQDMTVSVDIETIRHQQTLVVPSTTIRGTGNASTSVMKVDGAHARRQLVKVGIMSGGKAEILEGLRENELVLPANATLVNGSRIRAYAPPSQAP
jgi:HlyD family secretion protein